VHACAIEALSRDSATIPRTWTLYWQWRSQYTDNIAIELLGWESLIERWRWCYGFAVIFSTAQCRIQSLAICKGFFSTRHCLSYPYIWHRDQIDEAELRLGVVLTMGWGIAVLDGGQRRPRGRGGFGFFFHFYNGKCHWVADGERVKCFRFVCENLSTFPFGKHIVGKLDSWAFWRYIQSQDQSWGLREISKKVTIVPPKLKCKQQTVAVRAAITADNSRCICIFMNARYGAVLHRPRRGQPKLLWADLLFHFLDNKIAKKILYRVQIQCCYMKILLLLSSFQCNIMHQWNA